MIRKRTSVYGCVGIALMMGVAMLAPIEARTPVVLPVVLPDYSFQRFGTATLAVSPAVALTANASSSGPTWDDSVVTIWYSWTVESSVVPNDTVVTASITASAFVSAFAGDVNADARSMATIDVRSPLESKVELINCAVPGGGSCAKEYSGTIHINAMVNRVHTIRLDLNASAINGAYASGYIDPHFFIDPSVPNASQYTIRLSAGVSNALPIPTITSVTPTPVTAGQDVTLTVKGTGFLGGVPVVRVAGQPVPTTFVNGGELRAAVPAAMLCAPGPCPITVDNPSPGNGLSKASAFAVKLPTPDLVQNGGFAGGFANWVRFATPDPSYLASAVANGVVEFSRTAPPPGTSNSAALFQQTGTPITAGTALLGQFDLGNSSTVPKRISVLVLDSDFSDLSVCTFWLPPATPLRTYGMRTHSTRPWLNAAIYFYAASAGADGGAYRIDNVVLQVDPSGSAASTECVDPSAPAPAAGANGPDLLTNGNFAAGTDGWSQFGQLLTQLTGAFKFYRPSAAPDPAGVILQPTGVALAAGELLTAQFDFGNSSAVRKRVTVILHDLNFSDLSACTFWIAPGQPLSGYAMRSFASRPWANATISIYASSVGDERWTELDNVSLRKTPAATASGTDCVEPGGNLPAPAPEAINASTAPPRTTAPASTSSRIAGVVRPNTDEVTPATNGTPAIASVPAAAVSQPAGSVLVGLIDLRDVTTAQLPLHAWLESGASPIVVQFSLDGVIWETLTTVPASDVRAFEIDLDALAGQVVWTRFVTGGISDSAVAATERRR